MIDKPLIPLAMGLMVAASTEGTAALIERHSIGLVPMVGIISAVAGGVWWWSHQMTTIHDRIEELQQQIGNLWCVRHRDENGRFCSLQRRRRCCKRKR